MKQIALNYLNELHESSLEVVLIPAPDPRHLMHQVRAVAGQNPDWYREFCRQHPSERRYRGSEFKTKVKRQQVIRALTQLAAGRCESGYAKDLKKFILRRETESEPA